MSRKHNWNLITERQRLVLIRRLAGLLTEEEFDDQMEEASAAGEEAKKQGLKHIGFGRYADSSGKVVAKSSGGKLVPTSGGAGAPAGGDEKTDTSGGDAASPEQSGGSPSPGEGPSPEKKAEVKDKLDQMTKRDEVKDWAANASDEEIAAGKAVKEEESKAASEKATAAKEKVSAMADQLTSHMGSEFAAETKQKIQDFMANANPQSMQRALKTAMGDISGETVRGGATMPEEEEFARAISSGFNNFKTEEEMTAAAQNILSLNDANDEEFVAKSREANFAAAVEEAGK